MNRVFGIDMKKISCSFQTYLCQFGELFLMALSAKRSRTTSRWILQRGIVDICRNWPSLSEVSEHRKIVRFKSNCGKDLHQNQNWTLIHCASITQDFKYFCTKRRLHKTSAALGKNFRFEELIAKLVFHIVKAIGYEIVQIQISLFKFDWKWQ